MDLETENRIAAILMKEAAELRRQAQSEGALAYLRRPTVRSRPNSRFLTATVRGVQQANRAVEVSEMWRLREKQIELDNRVKVRNESRGRSCKDIFESHSRYRDNNGMEAIASTSMASKKRNAEDRYTIEDEGLRDDEVDEFLHSRSKRGRGAIGSRMDETGPYPSLNSDAELNASGNPDCEFKKPRPVLGPVKPYSLKHRDSSDDDGGDDDDDDNDESREDERKSVKKTSTGRRHSRKHKSKEKKKKREKERNKKRHHHHHHK